MQATAVSSDAPKKRICHLLLNVKGAQMYLCIAARFDGLLPMDDAALRIDAALSVVCIAEPDDARAKLVAARALALLNSYETTRVRALLKSLHAMQGDVIRAALGNKSKEQPLRALRNILDEHRLPFEVLFDGEDATDVTLEAELRRGFARVLIRYYPDGSAPERLAAVHDLEQAVGLFLAGQPRWRSTPPLTVTEQLRAHPAFAQLTRTRKKKRSRKGNG